MTRTCVSFFAVVVLLFSFATTNAQQNKPTDPAEVAKMLAAARSRTAGERATINAELDKLAQGMASSFKDPAFRKFLKSEIKAAKHREHILRLDEYLTKAEKRKDFSDKAKAAQRLKETRAAKEKIQPHARKLFGTDKIDIYFPVKEHRDKWPGTDDLLVAFDPANDETEYTEITAYSVKDGTRISLSKEKAPDTPVVIICVSEHDSIQDVPELKAPESEQAPPQPTGRPEGPEPPSTQEGKPDEGNSYMNMQWLELYDDHEPWTKGDPEIYVVCVQTRNRTYMSIKKDLPGVNVERQWCWTYDWVAFYFDGYYGPNTRFTIWERDGVPWWVDIFEWASCRVADYIVPGAGIVIDIAYQVYKVAEDDDRVGSIMFANSNIPLNGSIGLSAPPDAWLAPYRRP